MFKKDFTYTDFFGNDRNETCCFQLTQTELLEIEASVPGGLMAKAFNSIQDRNEPILMQIYKDLILKSYGEVSQDGRRFVKGDEISKAFSETPMYDMLFTWLIEDPEAIDTFMIGILPSKSQGAVQSKLTEIKAQLNENPGDINAAISIATER